MTREETIEILRELWKYEKVDYTDNEVREALDMAIAALKAETCEDAVSRKRVKYLIHTLHIPKEYEQPLWDGLDELPLVTPTRLKGKWIKKTETIYCCNQCGRAVHKDIMEDMQIDYPYCHCGAEMGGESE